MEGSVHGDSAGRGYLRGGAHQRPRRPRYCSELPDPDGPLAALVRLLLILRMSSGVALVNFFLLAGAAEGASTNFRTHVDHVGRLARVALSLRINSQLQFARKSNGPCDGALMTHDNSYLLCSFR